jgi:hypothetical protein
MLPQFGYFVLMLDTLLSNMNKQISELNTDVVAIAYYIYRMSGCPHGDTVAGFASWYKISIAGGFETFANLKKESFTLFSSIVFGPRKINEPFSCYEVGTMGCSKIEEKYCGQDEGGLDMYSYIVHFEDGTTKEIVDTFSLK